MPVDIEAAAPADLPEVRAMLEEYAAWLGIDLAYQGFARELDGLPGEYSPPSGALLIARIDGQTAGMVALRAREPGCAELKRLYVRPSVRGHDVGRALVERAMAVARELGYRRMVLDTLPVMRAAQRLYARLGFRDTAPYYDSPVPGTRFMEVSL